MVRWSWTSRPTWRISFFSTRGREWGWGKGEKFPEQVSKIDIILGI
jgi:hypothetical protein